MYIGETKRNLISVITQIKEHRKDISPGNLIKNPKSVKATRGQSGHGFNWECDRVLHYLSNYHKRIFLVSYINLKANTINDISVQFPSYVA